VATVRRVHMLRDTRLSLRQVWWRSRCDAEIERLVELGGIRLRDVKGTARRGPSLKIQREASSASLRPLTIRLRISRSSRESIRGARPRPWR
jgi:hypothetical protein